MKRPKLSLCMILRDEASMLPAFFESLSGLTYELVVVDTGSVDDTVALCEAAGARVLHFEWIDDFSAARNMGLEAARGSWILFLDADERPSEEVKRQITEVMADEGAGAATVIMRNELPHGNRRDAALLRLFRAHKEVRFRYPIHEDVTGPVLERLRVEGRSMVHLSGVVRHLGYVRQTMADRDKKQRDLRILGGCLREDPDDLYAHFKILELARFWGDQPLLGRSAGAALESLRRTDKLRLRDLHYGGDLLISIAQGHYLDHEEDQLSFLSQWSHRVAPSAALLYWRGLKKENLGQTAGAEEDFRAAMEVPGTRDVQMTTVRPRMGLCRIAMAKGDLPGATDHANHALDANGQDAEVIMASLFLSQLQGGDSAARSLAKEHEATFGPSEALCQALRQLGLEGQP